MRTVETKVYTFDELNESAKQKAIEAMADINTNYDWWEVTYQDAKDAGLQITGFDLDRNRGANGYFIESAEHCATLILENHGKGCETFKTASAYLADRDALVEKYSDGINKNVVTEENEYDFDGECDDLDSEFLNSILEDYSIILQKEYEWLSGAESITETIRANEYEFTEDGKLA